MTPDLLDACRQPHGPLRPTFCNVPEWGQWFIYIAGILAIVVFLYGLNRHRVVWMSGRQDVPKRNTGSLGRRLGFLVTYALGQKATLRKLFPGIFHTSILWGFLLLFIGTALATVDWDVWHLFLNSRILTGDFYKAYEFVLDTAGIVFIFALFLAMWRRYIVQPHYVIGAWDFVIWSLLIINVTGFLVEGMRLAMSPVEWGHWSWVGQGIANLFSAGSEEFIRGTLPGLHLAAWVVHAVAAVVFIVAIPFTNAVHLVTTAINSALQSLESSPAGTALQPIDLETAETFGVGRLSEFSWKQRLSFDACTRCGRCELVCPAYMSGTPLNPKEVIVSLSDLLRSELDLTRGLGANRSASLASEESPGGDTSADEGESGPIVVGEGLVIEPGALWGCTTCMACVAVCPAFIEIVDDIVDMRRYLTLTEGAVPGTAAPTMRNMGTSGNPWGYAQEDRLQWAEGLDVPIAKSGEHYDVLYWVGCSASYDQRNQRIARAMVKLLQAAQVRFAVMAEERCHAESARRMGDEYMYMLAAEENVANLSGYSFDRLMCHCPHCYNTLKNEYPDFGGDYDVVHHSVLLRELMADGRLTVEGTVGQKIVYHDSCYLGRYNGEYDAPREVLTRSGATLVEAERSRDDGLCCGGGGGRMWFEHEQQEKAIEVIRMEEVLEGGPETVGVACPFCLTMLESGAASMGADEIKVRDISEILADGLDETR